MFNKVVTSEFCLSYEREGERGSWEDQDFRVINDFIGILKEGMKKSIVVRQTLDFGLAHFQGG